MLPPAAAVVCVAVEEVELRFAAAAAAAAEDVLRGWRGLRRAVMAWTLGFYQYLFCSYSHGLRMDEVREAVNNIPVERARQDEVVVGAELVEPTLVEGPVVDQAARLVYDDECKNSPIAPVRCDPFTQNWK
jgi:hypothetical protein